MGVIPVYMADGLEPPIVPLIRWEMASIEMSEMQALDLEGMTKKLSAIPSHEVQTMTKRLESIRSECFETKDKLADCFVRSISILIRNQVYDQPPKLFAERMRMPLCPSRLWDLVPDFWFEIPYFGVWYENNTKAAFDMLF